MENTYTPKQFGQLIGKSVNTLQKWDRKGILRAQRSPTNRRYYTHDQYLQYRGLVAQEHGLTIVYCRVSAVAQKPDLVNQMKALEVYCKQHAIKVDEWMSDIGSGLNYKRKQFNRLMEMIEPEQELVRDLLAIVTVFSARLHGLRSYKKVLKDAALQKD